MGDREEIENIYLKPVLLRKRNDVSSRILDQPDHSVLVNESFIFYNFCLNFPVFFFFFFLLIVICYNNSLITTIIADVV